MVFLKKKTKKQKRTPTHKPTHVHKCVPSGPRDNSNGIRRLIDGFCPLVNFKRQMNPKQKSEMQVLRLCDFDLTLTSAFANSEDVHPSSWGEAVNRSCHCLDLSGFQTNGLKKVYVW